jgi:hypothetical protein
MNNDLPPNDLPPKRDGERTDELADRLRRILDASDAATEGAKIITRLFERIAPEEDEDSTNLEIALRNHCHIGAFRQLPQGRITERSLKSESSPWRILLEDNSTGTHSPIAFTNRALNLLGVGYEVAVRLRKEVVYFPQTPQQISDRVDLKQESAIFDKEIVFVDKKQIVHSVHSLGSGVGVTIPVIVTLATSLAELLTVEEPESHVHPRLQAAFGDLVIMRSKMVFVKREDHTMEWEDGFGQLHYEVDADDQHWAHLEYGFLSKARSNLILETHSEHLILRILRRIRETTESDFSDWPEELKKACPNGIRPEDVAVLYVEPGEDGAKVIELPVTPDGDFARPWPEGFFTERDRELF